MSSNMETFTPKLKARIKFNLYWNGYRRVRRILCKLGIHSWETHEGTGLWTIPNLPFRYDSGHVICKWCGLHLCNYISKIEPLQ